MANGFSLGASALTGGLNFLSSSYSAKKSYKYAQKLQTAQNQWMEHMSNTAHQREVADLRAAGLNPILSATGGSGASTPQAGSANQAPVDPELGAAVATALDYKRYKNEKEMTESNIDLNSQNARKAIYEGDNAHEQSSYINEQNRQLREFGPQIQFEQINNAKAQGNLLKAQELQVMQDILNSRAVTASTVKRNAAEVRNLDRRTVTTPKVTPFTFKGHTLPNIKAGKFGSFGFETLEY